MQMNKTLYLSDRMLTGPKYPESIDEITGTAYSRGDITQKSKDVYK